jgi:hypothetical protein
MTFSRFIVYYKDQTQASTKRETIKLSIVFKLIKNEIWINILITPAENIHVGTTEKLAIGTGSKSLPEKLRPL